MKFIDVSHDDLPDGIWPLNLTLSEEEKAIYDKWPIGFNLPKLPKRLIVCSNEFLIAVADEEIVSLKGSFSKGIWNGIVYTNGVPEKDNQTKIEFVKEQIQKEAQTTLNNLRLWLK